MGSGTKPLNICSVFFMRKASHKAAQLPCIPFRALKGSFLLIALLLNNVLNLSLLVAGQ